MCDFSQAPHSRLVPSTNLRDFLRVPHNVLELAAVALLALLTVQLELHAAVVGVRVHVEPEGDAALHGGPAVATLLRADRKTQVSRVK